jgi:tetratricopeptide (TPR) repeat protein
MKKITPIHILFLLSLLFVACKEKPVTNPADYAVYLQSSGVNSGLQHVDSEITFWSNRLEKNPGDIISESKIAGLYTKRFGYSGNIKEVKKADSLYKQVNTLNHLTASGTFRSLAANCITQHQFKQAQLYIDSALALGDDKYISVLMEFDIAMELGNQLRAREALNSLGDKKTFEYLIREAKYKDHAEGNLDAAIALMEQAYASIKDNPAPSLYLWIKSNLGDMYGHNNQFRESYKCYLDVLAKDHNYYHALKGIAWLAFSHDKDVSSAKKILSYLQQQHPVPDYDLMLAEMAAYENDSLATRQHLERFVSATNDPLYGGMYNKYLFTIQSGELDNAKKAFSIAEQEIRNRPTPEAFSWLAWAYCENGDIKKAMTTARLYVENKCFEPDALYYLGMIYKAGGNKIAARKYLTAAKWSSYELGPVKAAHIQQLLANL